MGEYGVGIGDGPAGQVGGGGGTPGGTNPFANGATDVGAAVGNFVNDGIQTLSMLTPLEMLLLVAVLFVGFVVLKRVF
ncbi:MAG: hypothetical protein L0221_18295 [Chloroflexi bacterium]|nr:hypothetical protein [Chloroflexota bacterium]